MVVEAKRDKRVTYMFNKKYSLFGDHTRHVIETQHALVILAASIMGRGHLHTAVSIFFFFFFFFFTAVEANSVSTGASQLVHHWHPKTGLQLEATHTSDALSDSSRSHTTEYKVVLVPLSRRH